MATSTLSPVQFHDDTLFLVEHSGEPFTPLRPIVEGMGLAWTSQRTKITANFERWGVMMIVTPSDGGDQQTLCMPVRKLPAFMASINPKKVREELRERIRLYQDECDNALWDYWTKGQAIKPAKRGRKPAQKAIPEAAPQTPAWPRFTPHTTMEEIEARLTALHQHVNAERYAIYKDLLNQFCTIHTPRLSSITIVCSTLSDAIFHLIDECITSPSERSADFRNPCTLVREVKAMMEALQG